MLLCVCVCIDRYMYIHVHTCYATPMLEQNDTEFGDDKNDIMAFNTLVRMYKLTWEHM